MSFSAALFDLDGTLQDSEVVWIEAIRLFLADHGIKIGADEATRLVYGRSASDIYSDVMAMPGMGGWTVPGIADAVREYYGSELEKTDIAFPTSVDLLKRLARTMPVAIVSGSPREDVASAARNLGVDDDLSLLLGAEDCSRGKPDPECFLKAASLLGVPPSECVVFEDSTAGVRAAKAAGMHCVALSREGSPKQDVSAADVVVADLADFHYDP